MHEDAPTREEWLRLYAAAGRVRELAPWQWMADTDVFGLDLRGALAFPSRELVPDRLRLMFVSVSGREGGQYAVTVYVGVETLYRFWVSKQPTASGPGTVVLALLLQVAFEERGALRPADQRILQALGLEFRGHHAWPVFRSDWASGKARQLTADDAAILAHALEQLLDVAPRFRANRALFPPPEQERYLVRTLLSRAGERVWIDEVRSVPQSWPGKPPSTPPAG